MRALNPQQLIDLLPIDGAARDLALEKFDNAAPILGRRPADLKRLVAEGFVELFQVAIGGVPAYLVGYHRTPDGGFWFDIVLRLASFDGDWRQCVTVVEAIARQQRAGYVRWVTYRAGVARWAQSSGYTPEAVILTKLL